MFGSVILRVVCLFDFVLEAQVSLFRAPVRLCVASYEKSERILGREHRKQLF